MWVWVLRGPRHFEPMSYSMWPQRPHRSELISVSLDRGVAHGKVRTLHRDAACYLLRGPVLARMSPTTRERLFWIVHEIWGPAAQPPYIRMPLHARCAAGPSGRPLPSVAPDLVGYGRLVPSELPRIWLTLSWPFQQTMMSSRFAMLRWLWLSMVPAMMHVFASTIIGHAWAASLYFPVALEV